MSKIKHLLLSVLLVLLATSSFASSGSNDKILTVDAESYSIDLVVETLEEVELLKAKTFDFDFVEFDYQVSVVDEFIVYNSSEAFIPELLAQGGRSPPDFNIKSLHYNST
jgi:hypothetical protein